MWVPREELLLDADGLFIAIDELLRDVSVEFAELYDEDLFELVDGVVLAAMLLADVPEVALRFVS